MLHAGLTGGLATGKSVVGRELESLGCGLIRMDELGHQVLLPDGAAYGPVVAEFGPSILNADGTIDRRRLGKLAFSDPVRLNRLNALTHPVIRGRARALGEAYAAGHPGGILVTEAAILIETGGHKDYDCLILTHCRPEQQLERAMDRDGLTREEAMNRIRRQMPLEEKKKYADFLIDTSGTMEQTLAQTRAVHQALLKLAHGNSL